MPWSAFRTLVAHLPRVQARQSLAPLEGVDWAIRRAFGDEAGELDAERQRLRRIAYPDSEAVEVIVHQRAPEPPPA
jgi:hypothetical protein